MAHDFMIPKHKRLTGQARAVEESRRAVLEFAKMVQKDRLLLLSIVTGGELHWRKIARKAFQHFTVDEQLIDEMFVLMVDWAGEDPKAQFEALQRSELVNIKMDRLRGMAAHITSLEHLDQVLDRWVPAGDERAAIRATMLPMVMAGAN